MYTRLGSDEEKGEKSQRAQNKEKKCVAWRVYESEGKEKERKKKKKDKQIEREKDKHNNVF